MKTDVKAKTKELLGILQISRIELLLGGMALVVLIGLAILNVFFANFGLTQSLHTSITAIGDEWERFAARVLITNITSLILWALIGLALFSLLWSLMVILVDIRNDMVISQSFLHPRSFHKSRYWIAAAARRIVAVSLYTGIFIYVLLLMRGIPVVYESIRLLLAGTTPQLPMDFFTAGLAVVIWLSGLHLVAVVTRLGTLLDKKMAGIG